MADPPAEPPSPDEPPAGVAAVDVPPEPPHIDRRKQIVAGSITLAVLVVVFVFLVPKFADYGAAWTAIKAMSIVSVVVLLTVTVVNVLVYVFPYQAALPGIRYWPAFVVRQTSFMISNVVPAGGAFGLGVQYGMLSDYGFRPAKASTAIAATSLWNLLVTLALPVVAVILLLFQGEVTTGQVVGAVVGLVLVGGLIALVVVVLRSESAARRVGGIGDRVIARVRPAAGDHAATDGVMRFRDSTSEVVFQRWPQLTVTSVLQQLCQFAVLAIAMYGIAGSSSGVNPTEIFAAFALARLAGFIPVTPGGLGTVDAALIALLVSFGADKNEALAANLVWRAATYFPQVIIGIVTLVVWQRQRARRRRERATSGAAAAPQGS